MLGIVTLVDWPQLQSNVMTRCFGDGFLIAEHPDIAAAYVAQADRLWHRAQLVLAVPNHQDFNAFHDQRIQNLAGSQTVLQLNERQPADLQLQSPASYEHPALPRRPPSPSLSP